MDPGNNGGDGFVVARLLKEWGWEVEVFLYGDPERMPPDARVNYERWMGMGEVGAIDKLSDLDRFTLLIDAIFGTGLKKTLPNECATVAAALLNHVRGLLHVCAIDIPSGICSDSGSPLEAEQPSNCFIHADLTVTFHALKLGHVLSMGPVACRNVAVHDIGIRPFSWKARPPEQVR